MRARVDTIYNSRAQPAVEQEQETSVGDHKQHPFCSGWLHARGPALAHAGAGTAYGKLCLVSMRLLLSCYAAALWLMGGAKADVWLWWTTKTFPCKTRSNSSPLS